MRFIEDDFKELDKFLAQEFNKLETNIFFELGKLPCAFNEIDKPVPIPLTLFIGFDMVHKKDEIKEQLDKMKQEVVKIVRRHNPDKVSELCINKQFQALGCAYTVIISLDKQAKLISL